MWQLLGYLRRRCPSRIALSFPMLVSALRSAAAALLLGTGFACTGLAAPAPKQAPDLFKQMLGKSDAAIDAKIEASYQQLFHGDPNSQAVYFPAGKDEGYIEDIANQDVRSEGMSYGMMIAVQMDRRDMFDRLWNWAVRHMRHNSGPRKGFFAWHCAPDGRVLSPDSASDGEEWFTMALFFAAHRWGHPPGAPNYEAEAQSLLKAMLHKGEEGSPLVTSIFDPVHKEVVFVPKSVFATFTDPSYHLPAFYELWSRWASDPADRKLLREITATSRAFFHRAANPDTGLMPDYASFDGAPVGPEIHRIFAFDAWRVMANVALDHAWWDADPWQVAQSNRILRFIASQGPACPNRFTLDGKPVDREFSPGLLSMAAVGGLAADPALARVFVQRLWDAPVPSGPFRYYDGLLHQLALLEVSGHFRIYEPPAHP